MHRFAVVRVRTRLFACAVLALAAGALLAQPASAASPNLVISQVYGGGGNTGAQYTHDYIEIFNRSTTTVTLNHSLQYTSATGTGLFGVEHDAHHGARRGLDRPGQVPPRPGRCRRRKRRPALPAGRCRRRLRRSRWPQGPGRSLWFPARRRSGVTARLRPPRPAAMPNSSRASSTSSATATQTSSKPPRRRPSPTRPQPSVRSADARTRTTTAPTSQPQRRRRGTQPLRRSSATVMRHRSSPRPRRRTMRQASRSTATSRSRSASLST